MTRPSIILCALLAACGDSSLSASSTEDPSTGEAELSSFSWTMAGALLKNNEPLTISAADFKANHFSYVGDMAINGCANDVQPYSCAANGCDYPGNPDQ